ncbi:hypothetical protein [Mitsuokella multacida]|uniref:hypothetical protein n=1 Tax=Mitsuokella multacida TaxID=52226 RepID=UPI00266555E7|nr:hypothetical protein [Mitsuokella multacida]
MKEPTIFEAGGKKYTLMFSIRSLDNLERSIGRSILSIIAGTQTNWMQNMTIAFTAYGLKYGLQNMPDKFDPYDVIDEIFQAGMDMNELTGYVLLAIKNTGLFTIRMTAPAEKTDKTKTQEKELKASANG